jgi:hypothetical protein
LILLQIRTWLARTVAKEIVRIQHIVAEEFEDASMKAIRAGFGHQAAWRPRVRQNRIRSPKNYQKEGV